MQYRCVGRSGLEVSRLALGTMTWGTSVDAYEAEDQLATFIGAGGTLIDTAPIYGDGACEELLGTLLAKAGAREHVVLAGKAGFARRRGEVVKDGSRRTLLDQLDTSLRQLGTDHLDLWQIHT
ncbi:MAG: aldo/keto reductase, partial [Aeromicrobium sp.]|nr:aldo/keto reductase [Aeromicrobium sp.]